MSSPLNCLLQFPNEILLTIFSHLDTSSLYVAGQVCRKWSDIVQIIHDKSWRSLTNAVMLKAELIGPKYKNIGWVEQEHSWNTCKCIDIAWELVPYDDLDRMEKDMEIVDDLKDYTPKDGTSIEIYNELEQPEAASRLAAAGILTDVDDLLFCEIKYDLSSVKNLSHLVRIVKNEVYLSDVNCKDYTTLFSHIYCKSLYFFMHKEILTDTDKNSLTEVLNQRVEQFSFRLGCCINFPYILNYEGSGKCREIEFEYDEDDDEEEFEADLSNCQLWASSKGWTAEVINETDLGDTCIIKLTRNWFIFLYVNLLIGFS